MRRVIICLILIGLTLPALAVGKVTTDPNAAGAAAPNEEIMQGTDTRLSKTVTISEARTPVWKILDDLTKSTGIVFKAGSGSYDWQVRDRKMSIFAKDVPLVQIMNSISHVMKFKWERKGDDVRGATAPLPGAGAVAPPSKWTYRLYMDRRTLLNAEAQRARAEEKEAAEQTKRRQNALDTFGKMSSMTEAEKAKLKDDNPFLYAVSKTGWGDSLGAFFREVPSVAEALASGQTINLEGASLTPSAQAGMLNTMKAEMELENRFGGGAANRTLPENLDPSKIILEVNQGIENAPMQMQGIFLGEMSFRYEGGGLSTPFVNPDSELIKWLGKRMIEADQSNANIDDIIKSHESEMAALLTQEVKTEAGGEPEIEHPEDPSLSVKLNLKPESPALYNVEMNLADASKLCVVSDFFPRMDWSGMPHQGLPAGETDLKSALKQIGDAFLYNWDKRDGVIELRDRNWFRKRAAQIPDAWLDKWRDELNKTGTIDIDNLAQIAQLTQEQLNANVATDEDFAASNLTSVISSGREILRFYSSLTADQCSTLMSGGKLDLMALASDQNDRLIKLLNTQSLGKLSSSNSVTMMCDRSRVEGTFLYDFRLLVDGKPSGHWYLSTAQSFKRPEPAAKQTPPPAKPAKP